jgi:regulator of PEP synthase PpsR (kinase-PPPase family)
LSDSLGETGEAVVKAAASQFNGGKLDIRRIPFINSVRDVDEALIEAAACKAAVVYTLVQPELKDALVARASELALPCVDIMGPLLAAITAVTSLRPRLEPGLIRKMDKAYFNKVEAVDFAVKYDDGQQPWGLARADVVIIGVSRTSKTPLCMYLAHKGIKAANLPLVPEVAPPEELFALPANKVVGVTINAQFLYEVRKERLKTLGLTEGGDYANPERIDAELAYARGIMRRVGCQVIDVTHKAVEETAAKILDYFRKGAVK